MALLAPMIPTVSGDYESINDIRTMEATIGNLLPYRNYTIYVQAISSVGLQGELISEVLQRTNSSVPASLPTPPPPDTPTSPTTTATISVQIADPRAIDTGRVM